MMERLKAFARRIWSSQTGMTALASYGAMVSTMIIGIFSVPVALHFLSKEEFGLWNIVGQSLGYLLLLDFGVASSTGRMLVGPLRAGDQKELNGWWTVLVSVLSLQGLLVLGAGWFWRDFLLGFFDIPPGLHNDAELLWGGMIVVNAVQMPFRAYSGILHCQNRWYIMHVANIIAAWINLAVFVGLLMAGFKTAAYVVATALSSGASLILTWLAVRKSQVKLNFTFALFSRDKVRQLFGYSSAVFVVGLAAQLTYMSQAVIIGKVLGLGAVAAFVVSCKSSSIAMQLSKRAFDAYSPRWLQYYVDGNESLVCQQWRKVMNWFVPTAVLGSLGILIFNRSFSVLYGGVDNYEGRFFDLMRAAWLILQTFLVTMNFVYPLSSRVRAWSLVGLADAVVQLGLSIVFARWMGSSGLMLGSMIGSAAVSIPFLMSRTPRELGVTPKQLLGGIAWKYLAGLAVIGGVYAILIAKGPVTGGWWPSPTEFILGASAVLAFLLLVVRRHFLIANPKHLAA